MADPVLSALHGAAFNEKTKSVQVTMKDQGGKSHRFDIALDAIEALVGALRVEGGRGLTAGTDQDTLMYAVRSFSTLTGTHPKLAAPIKGLAFGLDRGGTIHLVLPDALYADLAAALKPN